MLVGVYKAYTREAFARYILLGRASGKHDEAYPIALPLLRPCSVLLIAGKYILLYEVLLLY